MFTVETARELLQKAGVFYADSPEDLFEGDSPNELQTINFNDTWCWASAWGEYVPDDELLNVADLFWRYGWCGLLYWCSSRNDRMKSEFHDVNRYVQFVREEEAIRDALPGSSQRAYAKRVYTLGE